MLNKLMKLETNFIIGGESIYNQALQNLLIEKIYTTEIYKTIECDKSFLNIDQLTGNNSFNIYECSKFNYNNNTHYRFITYINKSCKNKKWET